MATLDIDEILSTFYYYPAPYGPTIVSRLLDFDLARKAHLELIYKNSDPQHFIGMRHDGDLARFFFLTFDEAVLFPLYCRINGF